MASTTALFTGLSGLISNSRRLDVIGNNIANVNTHGCCPTADGVKPYSLRDESCCREGDTNVIHGWARPLFNPWCAAQY